MSSSSRPCALRLRAFALAFAPALGAVAGAQAQDPALDLPHRRPAEAVDAAEHLRRGAAWLAAGWKWEAAREFRAARVADESAPGPCLALALAFEEEPLRAARFVWEALERKSAAAELERAVVEAVARAYHIEAFPAASDERFTTPLDEGRRRALEQELLRLAGTSDTWLADVARREEGSSHGSSGAMLDPAAAAAALRRSDAWLAASGAMPFEVPGYREFLSLAPAAEPERESLLARLPIHPRRPYLPARSADLPAFARTAPAEAAGWVPADSPGLDLPLALGGRRRLAPAPGKPTLVVFFLGFGCVHCVAQLADLDPLAPRFEAAGIEVLTIGTDTIEEVRAANQAAEENGVDPLHFEVLCDPEGTAFRAWHAWDEFEGEALHGTFLVDPHGRILWRDVSQQPFRDTEFLLAECRRLLDAWR